MGEYVKRIRIIMAIIVFMCTLYNSAFAKNFSIEEIENEIRSQMISILKENGYENCHVSVLNIPIVSDIRLPEGSNVKIRLDRRFTRLNSREYRTVRIYLGNSMQKAFGVPIEVKAYKKVLAAKQCLSKGSAIVKSNIYLKSIDVAKIGGNYLNEKEMNEELISTKVFRKDEIIDKRFTKMRPDVSKDNPVLVEFLSKDGKLNLTIEATALNDGNIGDLVCVRNKTYNRVYTGKVKDRNRVLIK